MKRDDDHDILCATVKRFPWPLWNREFVFRQVMASETTEGSYVVAMESKEDKIDYGVRLRTVRASLRSILTLEPLSDNSCKATLVMRMDVGGSIPLSIVSSLYWILAFVFH